MGARHPLPYAWAKTYSVLIEDDGRERVLHVSEGTSRSVPSTRKRTLELRS